MSKKELLGAIRPVAALLSPDINYTPVTTSDQIWVLDNKGGYKVLDDFLTSLQKDLVAHDVRIYGSTATELQPSEDGRYYILQSTVATSGTGVKTGDIIFVASGDVYAAESVKEGKVYLQRPALAKLATKDEVTGLRNQLNGICSLYVFKDEAERKAALKADGTAKKYKVGDTLLLVQTDVPDYWISAISKVPNAETGLYEIAELEAKVNIDPALEGEIKAATEAVKGLTRDVNALKAPKAEAKALDAAATPTATVKEGSDGKLTFSFGIPKGAEGPQGRRGAGVFVALINIGSNSTIAKADIVNGTDIRVGDTIFDNGGNAYTVEAMSTDNTAVHVSSAISGFNLKGPKGDQGPRGYQIKAANFEGDSLVFTTDEPQP